MGLLSPEAPVVTRIRWVQSHASCTWLIPRGERAPYTLGRCLASAGRRQVSENHDHLTARQWVESPSEGDSGGAGPV
jgi:hypothetical protein